MPLKLEVRFFENIYIVHCAGAIVLGDEVKSLEAALDRCAAGSNQVVLNMEEVNRVDSIGLGLLVRYMTKLRQRGGDLRLAAPPPFVVSLLNMTMLASVLQAHAAEQDAILSFLKKFSAQKAQQKHGPRVLVVDSSADLCVFVRSVLMQHGFNVQSAGLVRDAKTLLLVDDIDFILVGPGTPQLSSEAVAQSLRATAPKAATLQLGADFKSRNAHEAAEILLQMFGVSSAGAHDS